jgi:hypothetical protein
MRNGDIVSLAGREGLWIHAGTRPGEPPVLTQAKFVRATGPRDAITCGVAMATVVSSPSFTVGETVTHEHQPATVESDDGQTVVLTYSGRKVAVPPRFYETMEHEGRIVHSDRALLVRENIKKFINQENTTNVEI